MTMYNDFVDGKGTSFMLNNFWYFCFENNDGYLSVKLYGNVLQCMN